MTAISQKEAVVNEVKNILGAKYDPSRPSKELLTSSELYLIRDNIVKDIIAGKVGYSGLTNNTVELNRYVYGMICNHLKKAKELNGDITYKPSSSSSSKVQKSSSKDDDQIKELTKLLKVYREGSDLHTEVLTLIEAKKAASKASNKKNTNGIDVQIVPEEFKNFANSFNTP